MTIAKSTRGLGEERDREVRRSCARDTLPEVQKPGLDAIAEMLVRHVLEERSARLERFRALCDAEALETGVECGERF
jgi:hypothetical protein